MFDVATKEFNVVLIKSELHTERDIAEMAEILYEDFGISGLYIGSESFLSMFWLQKPTGVVVDCGSSISSVVVVQNYCRRHRTVLTFGGRDVTMSLLYDLATNYSDKFDYENPAHIKDVKRMKRRVAFVSTNHARDYMAPYKGYSYFHKRVSLDTLALFSTW